MFLAGIQLGSCQPKADPPLAEIPAFAGMTQPTTDNHFNALNKYYKITCRL
jgi:hypothetical protein